MSVLRARNIQRNESGLASIFITLLLMIIITLIVLGFAQISRRTQREALDNQLSSQAFYAAETGVNLVQSLMKDGTEVSKTTCANNAPYNQLANGSSQVYNSCLLVNVAPLTLTYDTIDNNGRVIPLQAANSAANPADTLTLTWTPKDATASTAPGTCPGPDTFLPTGSNSLNNCSYGVLRFDLVDTTAAGTLSPQSLENNNVTVFASPAGSRAPIVSPSGRAGDLSNVSCNGGSNGSCSVTVKNMNYSHAYYMRVSAPYGQVKVLINGRQSGTAVGFKGAQVVVDSTGKAQDVLRRVQVSLDQNTQQVLPTAISSSSNLCKKFTLSPAYNDSGCVVTPPSGGGGSGDPSAEVGGCSANCFAIVPASNGGHYTWNIPFSNISQNKNSDVTGCTWDFGDGQGVSGQACYKDDQIVHTYGKPANFPAYPDGCYSIGTTTTLTEYTIYGPASYPKGFSYPWCS